MSAASSSITTRVAEALAALAGIGVLATAAWWAFGQPDNTPSVSATAGQNLAGEEAGADDDARSHAITTLPAPEPLDLAAFDAPIWVASPDPPPPPAVIVEAKPAPPPPPLPLKLQLIAIATRDVPATDGSEAMTVFQAIVYDPDSDTLLTLETGQSLASGRSVERVDAAGVAFRDGAHVRTLALREPDPVLDELLDRSPKRSERKEPAR